MRSRCSCAGAARVRFDVRNAGADAHRRAGGGLYRGRCPPFPDDIPEQTRWRALTTAFAGCTPTERAIAQGQSVLSATVEVTKTTL